MSGFNRWQGPRSTFPWEEEALKHIRDRMPDAEPYRAWQTFTFTAQSGHPREVDLLIATPGGLYLVEIKSHPGKVVNQGSTWLFSSDRVRSIENPLELTNQKCKELKSQLEWAKAQLGLHSLRIPYVAPAVFLSDPALESRLDDVQRLNVYGRDDKATGLPGIWKDLLGLPPRSGRNRVDPTFSRKLPELLEKIGVAALRRHRKVGQWELAPRSLETGPTWEDYLAENMALAGQHRRVRIYLSELRATAEEREATRRAARREYLVLQGIDHPGILKALDFSDEHDAGPAVLFPHKPGWLRLDHYMAEYGAQLNVDTRLDMIRQLAEALDHAHRRHLFHRTLAARSVWVEFHAQGRYPKLMVADWQAALLTHSTSPARQTLTQHAAPALAAHIEKAAQAYLAPEFIQPQAESVPLDVFGLGACAYLILTGQAPAEGRGELLKRLAERNGLVPSAVADSMDPLIDELVRDATRPEVCDRVETVRALLHRLDLVEERLTAPEEEDPLQAARGAVIGEWKILGTLGKGSTARALLAERTVKKSIQQAVLKVGLNDAAIPRLEREAAVLRKLRDSRVVRLIEGPRQLGGRTLIVLDRAGETTLSEYLSSDGRLSIEELERYGNDLFAAVAFLQEEKVRHRDLKPDNLAIRTLPNRQKRLVLFDFSLADADERAVTAGTPPYLDPFVGSDRRPIYDDHAERYALAVTLHEMASAEHPSWGDGATEPKLLAPSETMPQLAEDRFDAQIREGLVAFFTTALARDAGKRFRTLLEMRDAWRDVFRALEDARPLSTTTTGHDEAADPVEARDRAAEAADERTPLAAAGLTPKALSVALNDLGAETVGQLIRIPGTRVQRLRGVGVAPRNELLKRAREWRRRFQITELAQASATVKRTGGSEETPRPKAEEYGALNLDDIVSRLVPKAPKARTGDPADAAGNGDNAVRAVLLTLALPGLDGSPSPVKPWAPQKEIAGLLGVSPSYVAHLVGKARERWAKEPTVTALRRELLDILAEHGRVMEVSELTTELLAHRGSALDGTTARLALAGAAVRVAIETEERLENPRLLKRRKGARVLVALVAEDDPTLPSDAQLLDYALLLGAKADELSRRDPLPVTAAALRALRGVAAPEGMPPLPDTRLVSLAAAASAHAAVTPRFEIYPVDLEPLRAVRLAQVGGMLSAAIRPEELRERVLSRLPALNDFPDHAGGLRKVLKNAGLSVEIDTDGHYYVPSATLATRVPSTTTRTATGLPGSLPPAGAISRLATVAERGGFLVIKARIDRAALLPDLLGALPDLPVSRVNVTEEFVTALREVRDQWGVPEWPDVLSTDTPDAPPEDQVGLADMTTEAFALVEQRIKALEGVVLLHDATPLSQRGREAKAVSRYAGGPELLARLADAARTAGESPHGVWLLAPMADPRERARLDGQAIPVIPGGNEELALSREVVDSLPTALSATPRRAS
ncbi:BREX system serine/threonine kinase PglW [Streptosporangium sp. LJ11]|uniref:BREX system serine/threonine kinase PglW n=1 Tax=Streptosporangium sp. LJ11 TaxID=3436927 RepID=UPI003F7AEDF7